jgi:hypothetical protein
MDWNKFWIDMVNAVIPVIAPALVALSAAAAGLLVQYIRLVEEKIKAERPDEYAQIEFIARNAVLIAEQLNIAGFVKDKKAWAVDYAQKELDKIGISADLETISNEIEKAVYEELTVNKVL